MPQIAGLGTPTIHKAEADAEAEARVESELREVIAAQAMGGIVERSGRPSKVAGPREADKAVAQILASHENEDHEDDDHARHRERIKQRRDQRADPSP